jgi:hypothetical protein
MDYKRARIDVVRCSSDEYCAKQAKKDEADQTCRWMSVTPIVREYEQARKASGYYTKIHKQLGVRSLWSHGLRNIAPAGIDRIEYRPRAKRSSLGNMQ